MKFIKYFFQFIIILFLFFIFRILGYQKASNLGSKIGKKFGKFFRSDKIISKNISFINEYSNNVIKDPKKIIDEVFSNYGRILSEYIFLKNFKNGKLKKHIKVYGDEILDEIKKKNKRVVFISGHFSNFELMAMFIDSSGIILSAIYRPLNNIFLNSIMEKIRSQFICKNQIKKGKSGTREMLKFLKKNFSVALMIDQRVSQGIKSTFFDKDALTTTIPAQFVKKFNCKIVPIFIERNNIENFNLEIMSPLTFNNQETVESITLKLNKILEKMIMRNPYQWIWSHNRWK